MSSIAESVQRTLNFCESGTLSFRNKQVLLLEPRQPIEELTTPKDLWNHYRAVESCAEFLDSLQLPLETLEQNRINLSTSIKSPKGGQTSPRNRTSSFAKRDKKQKRVSKKKKEEKEGSVELFIAK